MTQARILVAEDNPADVYLIREALRENGVICEMQVATDGREALRMLSQELSAIADLKLIVLDLNLPRHDGIEILEHLRESAFTHIPVVVLTSSDSSRDRQRALELGAARYVRKPSGLEQFLGLGAIFKEFMREPQAASETA